MTTIRHFGVYTLVLDPVQKTATITRRRGLDPLPDSSIQKQRAWLLTDLSAYVFEGYSVIDETLEAERYQT